MERLPKDINAGADVNAQDSSGNTALMLAIEKGRPDIAASLIGDSASGNIG